MLLGTMFLFACNNQPAGEKNEAQEITDSIVAAAVETSSNKSENTIEAKFIEFDLGDREHYIFEDKAGNRLDFAGCESNDFEFSKELDEKMANETNQGWGSNAKLQGKMFLLTIENKMQPEYQDGPMAEMKIIVAAKQLD